MDLSAQNEWHKISFVVKNWHLELLCLWKEGLEMDLERRLRIDLCLVRKCLLSLTCFVLQVHMTILICYQIACWGTKCHCPNVFTCHTASLKKNTQLTVYTYK